MNLSSPTFRPAEQGKRVSASAVAKEGRITTGWGGVVSTHRVGG